MFRESNTILVELRFSATFPFPEAGHEMRDISPARSRTYVLGQTSARVLAESSVVGTELRPE